MSGFVSRRHHLFRPVGLAVTTVSMSDGFATFPVSSTSATLSRSPLDFEYSVSGELPSPSQRSPHSVIAINGRLNAFRLVSVAFIAFRSACFWCETGALRWAADALVRKNEFRLSETGRRLSQPQIFA
jgi:hypothetical protein